MTRTPLEYLNYETVEPIELSVHDMLAIQSALFDAANWNESKGFNQTASCIRELRKRWEALTDEMVNEADRKCTEWLEAIEDKKRQKVAEEAAEKAEMARDEYLTYDTDDEPLERRTR